MRNPQTVLPFIYYDGTQYMTIYIENTKKNTILHLMKWWKN